ncbi:hypothetical protein BCR44DRAFT_1422758 [Catenaria anguillulae PL171]|uniref:NAD(P)-binding protein n=1 Tax=Catenaria anguillulae PL171 TaxID=765915 RepID=A0A1Y2I3G5_9FUNG|nr:hypothetical protein BCR44DRAFT_1422758 [Catenaria anguillulae PL171]
MISAIHGDLAKRTEVEGMVAQVKELGKPVDLLVNNAGMASDSNEPGEEGINQTITVNHLHVLLLTLLILPHMHPTGRIVFVASSLYTRVANGSPDLALESTRAATEPRRSYSVSKLYNLWTSQQLARLTSGTDTLANASSPAAQILRDHKDVTITALCPGFIPTTGLTRHAGPVLALLMRWVFPLMPFTVSLDDGIQRVWYASTATQETVGESVHGQLVMGNPPKVCAIEEHGKDMRKAREVWNRSVDLLGLRDSGWALGE